MSVKITDKVNILQLLVTIDQRMDNLQQKFQGTVRKTVFCCLVKFEIITKPPYEGQSQGVGRLTLELW